jgi:hypothetical protein
MTGLLETQLNSLPVNIVGNGESLQISFSLEMPRNLRTYTSYFLYLIKTFHGLHMNVEFVFREKYRIAMTPSRLWLLSLLSN